MSLKNYEDIVNYTKSPVLVLAGPGSGKTYLLADRVTRLLKKRVNRENITVITFGRDASRNMVDILTREFKLSFSELPCISTMHSLGNAIIIEKPRLVGLSKKNLIVQHDERVKKLLYRDAAFILNLSEEESNEARDCKQHGNCIKNIRNNKCKICIKYWEIMSKCNYLDFDDQILFACEILEKDKKILKKYQKQCQHLLIDEYQDINFAQFRLIKLLSKKSRNGLFAVGDDAQSIYGFRGSDPKFILSFRKDFPGAQLTTLSSSRRCHEKIMEDAFKILEKYYKRWTGKPKLDYIAKIDEDPKVYQAPSEIAEAKIISNITRDALQDKKSVLILAPKKDFFPLIIQELSKKGIPHNCSISFLPEGINIINRFLEWLNNPNENFKTRLIIEDLINFGIAKIPGAKKNKKVCKPETIKRRISEEKKIAKLWELIDGSNNLFPVIRSNSKYNETFKEISNALTNLFELFNESSKKGQGEFLKQLSCVSGIWKEPRKIVEDVFNVVNLLEIKEPQFSRTAKIMTMRKAKGLSYDVVLIVGLEDDIVPNPSSNVVEEARLFYVSMTRAKKRLYLVHSFKRPRSISYGDEIIKKPRSRFLDTIGKNSEWRRF